MKSLSRFSDSPMCNFWTNWIQSVVLVGLVVAQVVIAYNFALGETIYIATDILIIARDFALKRPVSDKIKNGVLTLLATLALTTNLLGYGQH